MDASNLPARRLTDETRRRLGPDLTALLDGESGNVVETLRANPNMLRAVRMNLDFLRDEATRPAGEAGVRRALEARMMIYRPLRMDTPDWALWWANYVEVLGDLPEEAIIAAMALHVRANTDGRFPTPATVRELAERVQTVAARAYTRARAAVEAPRAALSVGGKCDQKALGSMMAEYRRSSHAKNLAYGLVPAPLNREAAEAYWANVRQVADREGWDRASREAAGI
jgi:hypothetical protein